MPTTYEKMNPVLTATVLIVVTVLMAMAAWHLGPGWNWLAVIILMFLFMIVLGKALVGRGFGILINQRNLMSLSRFQMTVWTVVMIDDSHTPQ